MTITITQDTEDGLRERAACEGLDVEALAGGLLAVGLTLAEQFAEVERLTGQMAQDRAEIATLKAQTQAIAAEAESIRASLREMRLAAQRPRPMN